MEEPTKCDHGVSLDAKCDDCANEVEQAAARRQEWPPNKWGGRRLRISGGPSPLTMKIEDSETGTDLTTLVNAIEIAPLFGGAGNALRAKVVCFAELDVTAKVDSARYPGAAPILVATPDADWQREEHCGKLLDPRDGYTDRCMRVKGHEDKDQLGHMAAVQQV